jgi:DsbC/DsbD-like thiol-disulfide interchange protein
MRFNTLLFLSVVLLGFSGCDNMRSRTNEQSATAPQTETKSSEARSEPEQAKLATPEVSLSSDVVKISSSAAQIPRNGSAVAVLNLSISPGFHVNANPATFSYLIPTQLTTGKVEGIAVGTPVYPAAVTKKFQFAQQPLAVYQGVVPISLNLSAETNAAAGPRSLPVNVRVQACDEEQCFPPATINTTISVTVK